MNQKPLLSAGTVVCATFTAIFNLCRNGDKGFLIMKILRLLFFYDKVGVFIRRNIFYIKKLASNLNTISINYNG